jgi:hypothetical protein
MLNLMWPSLHYCWLTVNCRWIASKWNKYLFSVFMKNIGMTVDFDWWTSKCSSLYLLSGYQRLLYLFLCTELCICFLHHMDTSNNNMHTDLKWKTISLKHNLIWIRLPKSACILCIRRSDIILLGIMFKWTLSLHMMSIVQKIITSVM